jgi:hypothetical protein
MTYRMAYIGTRADSSHYILRHRRCPGAWLLAQNDVEVEHDTPKRLLAHATVTAARRRNDNVAGDDG